MNKKLIFTIFMSIILLSNMTLAKTSAANTKLGKVFTTWEDWGIFDIFLPLVLIYLIVFLAFFKSKIFEVFTNEDRKYSSIAAFIVSMIALVPHFTQPASRFDVIHIINNTLPKITLSLTMIVFILVLYGILFGKMSDNAFSKKIAAWGAIALVVLIYIDSALGEKGWALRGTFSKIKEIMGSEDLLALTFFIILGVIMWFITRPTSEANKAKEEKAKKKKEKEAKTKTINVS